LIRGLLSKPDTLQPLSWTENRFARRRSIQQKERQPGNAFAEVMEGDHIAHRVAKNRADKIVLTAKNPMSPSHLQDVLEVLREDLATRARSRL